MGVERWLCSSCGATSSPAPEPPPGCDRCNEPLHVGKYGLIELLAPEQSLRVFRGRESSGPREVNLRILPDNLSASLPALRQALKKFGSFSHPAIATPLDAGIHRGRAFVAEEFASGEALTRADLTLREAMGMMRDAALAIEAAHERGITHPDLHAECLRVSRGSGKLGGTGLKLTLTGIVGPGGGHFRANLHALGEILYTVATGRPPGPASPASLNPLVDTALEAIIQMAMDSEGSHQPPGAGVIAVELTRWLKGDAPSVRPMTRIIPPPPPKKAPFHWSRIRVEARIVGGVMLALVVLIFYLILRTPAVDLPSAANDRPEKEGPKPAPPAIEKPPDLPSGLPAKEEPKPAPPPIEPPSKPPPPAPTPKSTSAARVGVVHAIHADYGLFVKLDAGAQAGVGDELDALRDGKVVARLAVERITAPEKRYPSGCAVCKVVSGTPAAGDGVRRVAK